MSDEYVWVDVRWQDKHWLDVFRIRLSGWLPATLAAKSIKNGLLIRKHELNSREISLTQKAANLTDLAEGAEFDQYNCSMLANVLITKGYREDWMSQNDSIRIVTLRSDQKFAAVFRDNLLSHINNL
jgi:hypothetical protein